MTSVTFWVTAGSASRLRSAHPHAHPLKSLERSSIRMHHNLQRRVVSAFVWCELGDGVADGVPEIRDSACCRGAKQRLQFGEGALDRVEVRRVGRQVEQDRTCGLDRLANTADLV